MQKTSKTVVFFGSGPVAARSLELLARDFEVEAVITKPRPAHHRGPVPVLELAEKRGLKVFTPRGKAELSELFVAKPVTSAVGVVIDYGIIIAQEVIDYFPLGIVNSHFSLLPEWRGADPITFAILSGQPQTGVSLMLIVEKMDEGPLLAQATYDMPANVTTPLLTNYLIDLSHSLLTEMLPLYMAGSVEVVPQEAAAQLAGRSTAPSYSRKLTKEDGLIDWAKPAVQIERDIRAFIEWPKSRATLAGKEVVITEATVVNSTTGEPGVARADGKRLLVACGQGTLQIKKLKPAGKPEMTAEAFLAGYKQLL